MAYTPGVANYIFSEYSASLADGAEIDSGWLDMEIFDKYQFECKADSSGLDRVVTSSNVSGGGEADIFGSTEITSTFNLFKVTVRQRWFRFQIKNNTGSAITNVNVAIKTFIGASDGTSVLSIAEEPRLFSQAALTQSVLRGYDQDGIFQLVSVNTAGALLTTDFGTEVARGKYSDEGWNISTKFGRNSDIDVTSTPEDMWNGGGSYTGFNATQNRNIEVLSASANDNGSLISSGTVTSGDEFTLTDSGANFIGDGVSVGDCLVNDTGVCHGFITSIDSATQLTVFRMTNGAVTQVSNSIGDSYRVVSNSSTGASLIRIENILDSSFDRQPDVYAIMNGTSTVSATTNAMRSSRVKVVMAGSNNTNVGEITVRQAVDTANVFATMPATGQSTICIDTVPAGKIFVIKRIRASISRNNGSLGSANINLNVREPFGSWRAIRSLELQTGAPTDFVNVGGIVLTEGYDLKFTIQSVSDNNTIAEGALEYYVIDE